MTLLRRPSETELSPPSSPRHQVSLLNSRNSASLRSVGLDHVPVKLAAPPKNVQHDTNIESLIEKMKSGLEVGFITVSFTYVKVLSALQKMQTQSTVPKKILACTFTHNENP